MMSNLEELNRAINRVLRALNSIAVSVASSSLADRSGALREVTEALAHVDALQRLVIASVPDLEYHHDPNRPPSRMMRTIADLVDGAERDLQQGNKSAAEATLQRALEMEPPPLAYEMIEKRLISVRKGKT